MLLDVIAVICCCGGACCYLLFVACCTGGCYCLLLFIVVDVMVVAFFVDIDYKAAVTFSICCCLPSLAVRCYSRFVVIKLPLLLLLDVT